MITEQIYLKPTTVEEAIKLGNQHKKDFRFLAGGTDVMVNRFQGNESSFCLIDLSGIGELKRVSSPHPSSLPKGEGVLSPSGRVREGLFLKIGSLVQLDDLRNFSEIREEFPILLEVAHSAASPTIRKTATIGGNILCENRCTFYNQSEWWREAAGHCLKSSGDICIATGGTKACFSKFVSDVAPALISMDVLIEVASPPNPLSEGEGEENASPQTPLQRRGEMSETKIIPLEKIYTGDGIQPRNLDRNVIIKFILLPLNRHFKSSFKKLRQRESMDFSSLTTCVSIDKNGKIKIVLGAVDPKPIVVEGKITDDKDELIKQAMKKARIVDNDVFSREYRKEMIKVFLERSFKELDF